MENEPALSPQTSTPFWLDILFADCIQEVENSMILGESMLANAGRTMVWMLCQHFECDRTAVPALTCRVLEQFVVDLTLNQDPGNSFALWEYLETHMWLHIACSYQIAAKAIDANLRVSPTDIRDFLLLVGQNHTVEDITRTEWAIFFGIDFVPLYSSVQMGAMIAEYVGVPASSITFIVFTVQLAELHRHDVEVVSRIITTQRRIEYGSPRVYTLHLVAGCVAAAVQKASLGEPERTVQQLATLVRVPSAYIEALREAILVCISFELEAELPRQRTRPNVRRNNTGRKYTGHPYSRRSEGSEPGTSK